MSHSPRISLVFAARGGTGRSVVAANLAVVMARRFKQPTVLVDLDWLSGGSLASALDLEPAGNWLHFTSGQRPARACLTLHGSGLRLMAAPLAAQAAIPPPDQLVRLVADLGREAAQLVIDVSWPNLAQESVVALFDLASCVLLLITPDIPTLGATRAFLEQARAHHYPSDRIAVVLNRSGITDDLHPEDLVEHLERPILVSIPFHPAVTTSVNRGVPITASSGGGQVAGALVSLAQKVLAFPVVNLPQAAAAVLARQQTTPATEAPAAEAGTTLLPKGQATSPVTALVPLAYVADPRLTEAKQHVHRALVSDLKRQNLTLERLSDPKAKAEIRQTVQKSVMNLVDSLPDLPLQSREQRAKLINDVTDEAIGFGPLERLLADEAITEIMVNGPRQIYVEKSGRLTLVPEAFTDETQLRVVIDRIVAPIGRRVDESSPMCDARLPDGSRVNVVVSPLSLRGSTITIRKFPNERLTMGHLLRFGSISEPMAQFLECCVKARLNVFISGGTGSGKTTLLNVLSGFIPEGERIVTIEDAAELRLDQAHVIPLESRAANLEGSGAISIRDLVRNALRMRPDRIVVGEVRGGEALDMLQAMNTGHDGSLCTGHANTPRDALSRLETMVLMAGMDLPIRAIREQIASAINVVVQVSRMRDGSRKVTKITEITGMESDVVTMQDLFAFETGSLSADGRVGGEFTRSTFRSQFADHFERFGLEAV